ncbi:MAG: protease modulator HflC, partial [Lachnospiraceae bacterium]|nr:protease modulator HflC [Lachnospiraceae bacterium]
MKTFRNIALVTGLFVLLIIGASSIVVTQENEYSLIRQFGRIDHVITEAGISFKIPFIQTVDK